MATRRIERLNEQLKREIIGLLQTEVRDPRIGAATITEVDCTPDLSFARVYVSTLGDEDQKTQTLEGLTAAAPFIRSELGRRIHIRRIPELRFEHDRALEYAMRIEKLLKEALPTDRPEGAGDGDAQ